MQITLQQPDVEKAIALYLESMGVTAQVSGVSFKAGRKDSGLTTTVNLVDTQHASIPEQPKTVAVPQRAASKQNPDAELEEPEVRGEDIDGPEQAERNEEPVEEAQADDTSDSLFK